MRTGTENKGTATKEAAGGVGRCTTWNTTTQKRTIRHTSMNMQGCFIRAPFSYTHSTFSTFICMDGCVSQGWLCHAVHVNVEAQAATCTKAHRQQLQGKTRRGAQA